MHKILILSNSLRGLILTREELIIRLMNNYKVVLLCKVDTSVEFLSDEITIYDWDLDRLSLGIFNNLKGILTLLTIIIKERPLKCISFTIKPNVYFGFVRTFFKVQWIAVITGLGRHFYRDDILSKIIRFLLVTFTLSAKYILFENHNDMLTFSNNKVKKNMVVMDGAGVNLDKFLFIERKYQKKLSFLYSARISKDKGIEELLYLIELLKINKINHDFVLIGEMEEAYKDQIEKLSSLKLLRYDGFINNVLAYYYNCDALIMPSHHEGLPNVILEASSCGRPVISSDIPGSNSIIVDGYNGFLFSKGSVEELYYSILKFSSLSFSQRKELGINARKIVEERFGRELVVDKYINLLER